MKRRTFIKESTIASTAILASPFTFSTIKSELPRLDLYLFSKALQFLDYESMSVSAKKMGFDGLDLTIRPKGHVLPENVDRDLPIATEIMQSHDLSTKLFCSKVTDITDPVQLNVLRVASQLGYESFRTGWYKYDLNKDINQQVASASDKIEEIAKVSSNLNLNASYQNHSGHYLGSGIWDLFAILNTIQQPNIGAQYDIMHHVIEGGKNWEVGFNLIKPYINTLVLKDFIWEKKNEKWDRTYVPMGTGIVDFEKYFALLKKHQINVPVSLHIEYDLGGAEHGKIPTMAHEEIYDKIKKDVDYIRALWNT